MKTVWKYVLKPGDVVTVNMPRGATILSVGEHQNVMFLWALVDPAEPYEMRQFCIAGTGHERTDLDGRFIGTIQLAAGMLVLHVFEVIP